jgi:hypothetical protein
MDYSLNITDHARVQLRALPPEIAAIMPHHFQRLSASPVSLSIPGAPPASLPDRMIYPFPVNLPDGREFTVRIHFKYGQDEQTLFVVAVTAIQHA